MSDEEEEAIPTDLRLAAAYGGLDWARQALIRVSTHLRLTYRPALAPMVQEVNSIVDRLTILGRLVNAAYEEERGKHRE